MRILTPEFLEAKFFMKGEPLDGIDDLPRVSPHQVHGSEIVRVNDDNFAGLCLPERPSADGVLLTTSKASASLRFADCAPVMLWGRNWVMILHSGYKGTVLNISGKGLKLVNGETLGAWVGPCIGREHYCRDIDDEWTQKGLHSFRPENMEERDGKIFFDLAGEIRSQLIDGGMKDADITLSGIDTFTDERCCSYRRGNINDRMTLCVKLIDNATNTRL